MVKTRQQMAAEYGISCKTLSRRLKQAGIDIPGGLILPTNQTRIYSALGFPQAMPRSAKSEWERAMIIHARSMVER